MNHRAPIDVVQDQLDAYNTRNVEAFLKVFHDDAEFMELGASMPATKGKEAIKSRYAELFVNSPGLHSAIVNRTVFGRVVIDLEHIVGRNGSDQPYDVLAIYEVDAGLIRRVHFVRPQA